MLRMEMVKYIIGVLQRRSAPVDPAIRQGEEKIVFTMHVADIHLRHFNYFDLYMLELALDLLLVIHTQFFLSKVILDSAHK